MEYNKTVTFTAAEVGENHVGMEAIDVNGNAGVKRAIGFTIKELKDIAKKYVDAGFQATVHKLKCSIEHEPAAILVIREAIHEDDAYDMYKSVDKLKWDAKYLDTRSKKVLNKRMRRNLLFANFAQVPNYEAGKGCVVKLTDVPLLHAWLLKTQEKCETSNLIVEGNQYHDPRTSGIGYHGDTERRIVIGLRIGRPMNLVYEWYINSERTGDRKEFVLNNGDMYIMSDKATGYDWKTRKIPTLRHAAGCEKVTE